MQSKRYFYGLALVLFLVSFIGPFVFAMESLPDSMDKGILAEIYVRYLVYDQVAQQAKLVADSALPEDQAAVTAAADQWSMEQMDGIRVSLDERFGDRSKSVFEQFVADYSSSENSGDPMILSEVTESLHLEPSPRNYAALKKSILTKRLMPDVRASSQWLSEVQTWVDLKRRGVDGTPSLDIWLTRGDKTLPVQKHTVSPKRKKTYALEDAEPELGEFVEIDDEEFSPLDSFDSMRKKRREKAVEEAQEGMRQVSDEREAAEEEYASKKLAAATAEAEAMKRQAEKLAAVEKDALEQREKSWGNRLKSIVGATVSAGVGAFTGGVGARAGEEAVNAIFK